MTTPEAVREMVKRCRVQPKESASISSPNDATNQAASAMPQHGSSGKPGGKISPQVSALRSATKLTGEPCRSALKTEHATRRTGKPFMRASLSVRAIGVR